MGTSSKTSTNGQSKTQAAPKTLPADVRVNVNGTTVIAPSKPSKAGNIWYEASLEGSLSEGVAAQDALASFVVEADGLDFQHGEVHVSAPRVFGRNHPKAGQAMPGTGGNLTVTHSADAPNMGDGGYRVMVTATHIAKREAIRLVVKAIPKPGPREVRTVGTAVGNLTF